MSASNTQAGGKTSNSLLKPRHWNLFVKTRLEALIAENAGKGKVVVFDFDNTMLCRDIGEATFVSMTEKGLLTPESIPQGISPSFFLGDKHVSIKSTKDLKAYYEVFLLATNHHAGEENPYTSGYTWLTQIMSGIRPSDIIPYTEKAYGNGVAVSDSQSDELKESHVNEYPQPFFFPEMVDLVGVLLKNGYDVYFASASNVWTVRWMVINRLLPMIQEQYGKNLIIPPSHVFGTNVLLKDTRSGKLYKDSLLVKENMAYAQMDLKELVNYELTTQINYPLSEYHGKVATLLKYVTQKRPFLAAGDSPNDYSMLNWSENRLWIARLEKMGYQKKTLDVINSSLQGEWLLQPVLYKKSPGFVSSSADLSKRFSANPDKAKYAKDVVDFLEKSGGLVDF